MGLGALLCVLSWAIVGSCYPITEVNTVESDTVQVLSQTVEYTDNVSSRAPKEQQVLGRANESPLSGVQNFFSNMNFLNGSNPFSQLSASNNNLLNDVHVFLVANQGLIFPASTFFKGFDFLKGFGNVLQNIPIKLPFTGDKTN